MGLSCVEGVAKPPWLPAGEDGEGGEGDGELGWDRERCEPDMIACKRIAPFGLRNFVWNAAFARAYNSAVSSVTSI